MAAYLSVPVDVRDQNEQYYTPPFDRYTHNLSRHNDYNDRVRRRQRPSERVTERRVEQDEWTATQRVLEDVLNSFRGNEVNRPRRREAVTAPHHAPRRESLSYHFRDGDMNRSNGREAVCATYHTRRGTNNHTSASPARHRCGVARNAVPDNRWENHTYQPAHRETFAPTPPTPSIPVPRRTERPSEPIPVLNPYLDQHQPGIEPITFDISRGLSSVAYRFPRSTLTVPWGAEDFNLPACEPPATDMMITVVVDDRLPHFDPTIVVSNPEGITCGDVLHAVWCAFHRFVPEQEVRNWSQRVQVQRDVSLAFHRRTANGVKDGVRRIDYMFAGMGEGKSVMFRGLMPAFEATGGWLMFVGAE